MSLALRVAFGCWWLPLGFGLSVFGLWLATRWPWLLLVELYAIVAGAVGVAVGLFALLECYLDRRAEGLSRRAAARGLPWVGLLLLSNLGVAFGLFCATVDSEMLRLLWD